MDTKVLFINTKKGFAWEEVNGERKELDQTQTFTQWIAQAMNDGWMPEGYPNFGRGLITYKWAKDKK